MAQGEFTPEEAEETCRAIEELFEALPKSKKMNYIGHLNDIFLFMDAVKKVVLEREAALKSI